MMKSKTLRMSLPSIGKTQANGLMIEHEDGNRIANIAFMIYMDTLSNNPTPCAVCGGTQQPTTITHHARRGGTIYVFENVPAYVCDQCGEVWIDGSVLHRIDKLIAAGKISPAPVTDYGRLVPA